MTSGDSNVTIHGYMINGDGNIAIHGYATNINSNAIYDYMKKNGVVMIDGYMTNVGNATTNGYVMNCNGYMMNISNGFTTWELQENMLMNVKCEASRMNDT
jgi:hypothetical protein